VSSGRPPQPSASTPLPRPRIAGAAAASLRPPLARSPPDYLLRDNTDWKTTIERRARVTKAQRRHVIWRATCSVQNTTSPTRHRFVEFVVASLDESFGARILYRWLDTALPVRDRDVGDSRA
jgi:hypothetical protein